MKRLLLLCAVLVLGASTAFAQNVKLGILMGFSGGLGSLAPAIETGALLAVDHANQAGGPFGARVETVSRDSQTNPGAGRDAAARLVDVDGVPAIVGALSSGVTTAVTSVIIPNQTVMISPSSTAPTLTDLDDNDYFFRTCPSDALQGVVQGDLAIDQGYRRASVIYVNNPYGQGLAENFRAAFEGDGRQVVNMVPYEENKPSYRGEAEQALRNNPDVINVISYPADGNKQLVSLIEQGYSGDFIFADGMKAGDVAAGPARRQVSGFLGTAAASKESEVTRRFESDYEAYVNRTGRDVDPSAPYRKEAYDAAAVIILAIAAVGPDFQNMGRAEQGQAIRDNLRRVSNPDGEIINYGEFERAFQLLRSGQDINYNGVTGPVTFDDNGDISESTFEIWGFEDGQVVSQRMVDAG